MNYEKKDLRKESIYGNHKSTSYVKIYKSSIFPLKEDEKLLCDVATYERNSVSYKT